VPPALTYDELPRALDALRSAENIVIACHINPDGDTIGSMVALALGLEQLGKRPTLLSSDGIPQTLTFLPGLARIQTETDARNFDLAVVVDAGEMARVGKSRAAVESAPVLLDIDHHVTPGPFGTINLLDARAAATGEIIYDVLTHLGVTFTPEIAQCLLCALLTDTGSFRYMNVTPRTMALAGALIEQGGSPTEIAEEVFEKRTYAMQKLLGRAMESLQRTPDGRIVWAHVTQADFDEFGATDADTEGIVGAVRAVRDAEVALFFREMASGKLRVSLRAHDPHDVASVAQLFGGGGHRLAAGCTLNGPLADAERVLVNAVQDALYRENHIRVFGEPPTVNHRWMAS
jgi:bifunctional oligoribonuclease and PAP phosphatase NrnA